MDVIPQCFFCRHFQRVDPPVRGKFRCAAFPTEPGIPFVILANEHLRTKPYPGDRGIRFEPKCEKRPMTARLTVTKGTESGALRKWLRELADLADPRSRKMERLRGQITALAKSDNFDKLTHYGSKPYAGVDRFG